MHHIKKHSEQEPLPTTSRLLTSRTTPPAYIEDNPYIYDENYPSSDPPTEPPAVPSIPTHEETPQHDHQFLNMPAYEPNELNHLAVNTCKSFYKLLLYMK